MLPATLDAEVQGFARASRAPNTLRAYKSDARIWVAWCEAAGYVALPAAPGTVAAFLADQARACSAATVSRRLAAIIHLHKAANLAVPVDDHVRQVLAGIRRTLGPAQKTRLPLVADSIKQIIDHMENTPRAVRDRALILLGFSGALRRSELAALTVADLSETPQGLLVTIRQSKGDQEGRGQQIGIAPASQLRYDAAEAVKAWLVASGKREGRIFDLSPFAISRIVKRRAQAARIDNAEYIAAHSLRSGALKLLELSRHRDFKTVLRYVNIIDRCDNWSYTRKSYQVSEWDRRRRSERLRRYRISWPIEVIRAMRRTKRPVVLR